MKPKPKATEAPEPDVTPSKIAPAARHVDVKPVVRTIAAMEAELAVLCADYKTTIDEQRRLEGTQNAKVPPSLLVSRYRLERMIEAAEKELVIRSREQADANYAADKQNWKDLQRQRGLLIVALRRCNRSIEQTYRSYCVRDGQPSHLEGYLAGNLQPFSYGLFGFKGAYGASAMYVAEYLRQLVVAKILSEREILDE
jgi:hypothetical protein